MKYNYTFSTPSGTTQQKTISLSTKLILKEAEKHGVKWQTIHDTEIIQLKYKDKVVHFRHQISPLNSQLSFYICKEKENTNALLKQNGISVSQGYIFRKDSGEECLQQIFEKLTKPLVIKPHNGEHGDSVTVNIDTFEELKQVIDKTFSKMGSNYVPLIIEEMFSGTEYRVTATRKKIIGITKRVPANVIGNGTSTIKELIEEKNSDPIREDNFHNTGLKKIPINDETIWALKEQNLSLETVPTKNELIFVRLNSNLSTGGDSIDFTDKAHESVKKIALQVMNAIPGLEFAGIDFMCKDITKKQSRESYIIVEINSSPGIFMHDKPFKGKNRHAAQEFLFLMFPELKN